MLDVIAFLDLSVDAVSLGQTLDLAAREHLYGSFGGQFLLG